MLEACVVFTCPINLGSVLCTAPKMSFVTIYIVVNPLGKFKLPFCRFCNHLSFICLKYRFLGEVRPRLKQEAALAHPNIRIVVGTPP